MDGFEALTEAMNQCAASLEQIANALNQSETPCGHIKAKHIRTTYGKGARPVKAHKRITKTREGFRK